MEPVFLCTAPKTGTHLLFKTLKLMTGKSCRVYGSYEEYTTGAAFAGYILDRPDMFCHTHKLPPQNVLDELFSQGIKLLSIVRDPRDQLISLIFFEHRTGNYVADAPFFLPKRKPALKKEDVQNLLDLILLHNYWPYNGHHMTLERQNTLAYLGENALLVRFEDLVGARGGGSEEAQTQTIRQLALFLGMSIDDDSICYIANHLFGQTWSFRSGKIGEWKLYFTEEHRRAFNKHYGYILENLNYSFENQK